MSDSSSSTRNSPESLDPSPRLMAYAELLRLPNVFTAMADVLLGLLFTHPSLEPGSQSALLVAGSSALYLAGMVLNDLFDRDVDAQERPKRPIPSGRIRPVAAFWLGFGLLAAGVVMAWCVSLLAGQTRPVATATLLAVVVLAYDRVLKRTPLAPLAMGACRFLNVLLGMSTAAQPWQSVHFVVAGGVGLYIAGVTAFARSEARQSNRLRLALSTAVMLCGIGLLAWFPAWASGSEEPAILQPDRWFLFWILIAALIGRRCFLAIIDPQPKFVQLAVKNCIVSLIILDAAAVLAVQERFWAFVILALIIPTMALGHWIYST